MKIELQSHCGFKMYLPKIRYVVCNIDRNIELNDTKLVVNSSKLQTTVEARLFSILVQLQIKQIW